MSLHMMICSLVFVSILVFNVILSLGCFQCFSNKMSIFGYRAPGDDVVLRTRVTAPNKKYWFRIHKETYGLASQTYHITQIVIIDQKPNPPFGKCKIVGGGPRYRQVSLECRSPFNYPVNFLVEVYGIWTKFYVKKINMHSECLEWI